jgi:hypothetical protein
VVLLTGCGAGRLDRGKAAALIAAKIKSPEALGFPIGIQYNPWPLEALLQKGLITYTPAGQERQGYTDYPLHDIELTPEGRKYKVGESFHDGRQYCLMKVADQVFGEITGIRESPGGDSAEVEFTWKYINVTPFGGAAPLVFHPRGNTSIREYSEGEIFTQTVTLKKYDDGWRIPTD